MKAVVVVVVVVVKTKHSRLQHPIPSQMNDPMLNDTLLKPGHRDDYLGGTRETLVALMYSRSSRMTERCDSSGYGQRCRCLINRLI